MKNIGIISLGCAKNLVDSELIIDYLKKGGYEIINDLEKVNILVINTCAFIDSAKQESIDTILEFAQLKEQNLEKLVVAGCMVNRYKNELKKEIPEIDFFVESTNIKNIIEIIENREIDKKNLEFSGDRVLLTNPYFSYLKISDGCNNWCSYCAIPIIRGNFKSRKMETIVDEAKRMVDHGVKELNLIAQDTTNYGSDIYNEKKIVELIDQIEKIDGDFWIRLLYLYPSSITDRVLDKMAESKKLLNYFDIPIQHSEDRILSLMNRRYDKKLLYETFEKIRNKVDDPVFRTSIIVGFPSETREDFKNLCSFIKDVEFNHLGVFSYSKEEDTKAFSMKKHLKDEEKERRKKRIYDIQKKISHQKNKNYIGKTLDIFIEGPNEDTDLLYNARSYIQAPDVDEKILINAGKVEYGKFLKCKITKANPYQLIGKIVK